MRDGREPFERDAVNGRHAIASGWIAKAACGLIVFLATAMPYDHLLLYHFYVQGAYFWDTGSFAAASWHGNGWVPNYPIEPNSPLFAYHMMPLFSLFNLVSWHLPLGLPQFYGAILAVGHAVPAVAAFWLLVEGLKLRSLRALLVAATLAVLFGFNGLALAVIRFPHPEILNVGGIAIVFAALVFRRFWLLAISLIVTLSMREDAGLHIFGLISVLIVLNRARGRDWRAQRAFVIVAVISLLYSASALVVQRLLYHGAHSTFIDVYLGNPPFHDFSTARVANRLIGLTIYRAYLVLPALVAVVWAISARNALIVAGYIAFLPWLVLQLIATSTIAGTLSGYYAYPFLIAALWPLLGVIIDARQRGMVPDRKATLIGFSAMLAASFVGVGDQWKNGVPVNLWAGFTSWPSVAEARLTENAVATLAAATAEGGSHIAGILAVDQGIRSLAPSSFPVERHAYILEPRPRTDTVAFFANGPDSIRVRDLISRAGLTQYYRFAGTSITVASTRDLTSIPGLQHLTGGPGS